MRKRVGLCRIITPLLSGVIVFTSQGTATRAAVNSSFFSGNGSVGGLDSQVTMLVGPEQADFAAPFDATDFESARSGPPAHIINPLRSTWLQPPLSTNADAKWITSQPSRWFDGNSTLFAIDFNISGSVSRNAYLDLSYAVDNKLGGAGHGGLFINGQTVPGTSPYIPNVGEFEAYGQEHQFTSGNIASLLNPGTNTLYLYNSNVPADGTGGRPSGIIFDARIKSSLASLLFREGANSSFGFGGTIPLTWDHVALNIAGQVYESHPGYNAGQYVDPNLPDPVVVDERNGVQNQHTRGSFMHNSKTSLTSGTKDKDEVFIPQHLGADMLQYIHTQQQKGAKYPPGLDIPTWIYPETQKGAHGTFTCVGLIEKSAEVAGYNDGAGFIPYGMELPVVGFSTKAAFLTPQMLHVYADWAERNGEWSKLDEPLAPIAGELDPVDFILTDPLDRRLGHVDGITYNEIPDGNYSGDGDLEFFHIMDRIPGEYELELFGVGEDYEVGIKSLIDNSSIQQWTFSGHLDVGDTRTALFHPVPEPGSFALVAILVFLLVGINRLTNARSTT